MEQGFQSDCPDQMCSRGSRGPKGGPIPTNKAHDEQKFWEKLFLKDEIKSKI